MTLRDCYHFPCLQFLGKVVVAPNIQDHLHKLLLVLVIGEKNLLVNWLSSQLSFDDELLAIPSSSSLHGFHRIVPVHICAEDGHT